MPGPNLRQFFSILLMIRQDSVHTESCRVSWAACCPSDAEVLASAKSFPSLTPAQLSIPTPQRGSLHSSCAPLNFFMSFEPSLENILVGTSALY